MKTTKRISLLISFISLSCMMQAQIIPFNSDKWTFTKPDEVVIEEYKGQQSLQLKKGQAFLKDVEFTNGIIEYDVCFKEKRAFSGVLFRVQDNRNYEEFYLRAHQSGNDDACQYTPVFNGQAGWQLYHGEGYSTALEFDFDNWMHVKLIVKGKQAEIYFRNSTTPSLVIHELKRDELTGYLGIKGNYRYANFSYKKLENPSLKGDFKSLDKPVTGTIDNWQVSSPFSTDDIETKINQVKSSTFKWHETKVEFTGLLNINRYCDKTKTENTCLVKTTINSNRDVIKKLDFGYSDMAQIYCNGTIIYEGQRIYRSRDYRYLGTIGYFDAVYLPLKKGANEIIVVVSENFGGWGLKAKLNDND
ncbi:MAG: hypothetical protein MI922_19975 [Bacteroidales bacterium]|nr:hypothetical protein [Bacteroidales bacterium]